MSKPKLKKAGFETIEDKTGKKMTIIKTKFSTDGPPCKECKRNARAESSSRCVECSQHYKLNKAFKERLQKRRTNYLNNLKK